MLKLIKYEFIKAKNLLIIAAITLVLIEGMVLTGKAIDNSTLAGWGIGLFIALFFIGTITVMIFAIKIYLTDIKNKHGYMLFLVPRNTYQIVGSKIITAFIVFILSFSIYVSLAILNISIYTEEGAGFISALIKMLYESIGTGGVTFIILYVLMYMIEWFMMILMVYFAITFTYTFLRNAKLKFFIILLMSIGMLMTIGTLTGLLMSAPLIEFLNKGMAVEIEYTADFMNWFINEIGYKIIMIGSSVYLILGIGFYFATSFLAKKKLSL